MSTRHARRIQAAYLGWCYIHGLKAASVKNLYWYAAQQSPEAQRALLGSSPTGLVDPKKMWNNFNELNVHGQGGVGHAPHKQQQQQPQTQTRVNPCTIIRTSSLGASRPSPTLSC
jgi:hypothetical protein